MERIVYWCSVEYSYRASPDSQGEAIGGFVYGFVLASDNEDAKNKFKKELEKGGRREPIFDFVSKSLALRYLKLIFS